MYRYISSGRRQVKLLLSQHWIRTHIASFDLENTLLSEIVGKKSGLVHVLKTKTNFDPKNSSYASNRLKDHRIFRINFHPKECQSSRSFIYKHLSERTNEYIYLPCTVCFPCPASDLGTLSVTHESYGGPLTQLFIPFRVVLSEAALKDCGKRFLLKLLIHCFKFLSVGGGSKRHEHSHVYPVINHSNKPSPRTSSYVARLL